MVKARDATDADAAAAGRPRLSARVVGCWWRQRRQRDLRSFILRVVVWLVIFGRASKRLELVDSVGYIA